MVLALAIEGLVCVRVESLLANVNGRRAGVPRNGNDGVASVLGLTDGLSLDAVDRPRPILGLSPNLDVALAVEDDVQRLDCHLLEHLSAPHNEGPVLAVSVDAAKVDMVSNLLITEVGKED